MRHLFMGRQCEPRPCSHLKINKITKIDAVQQGPSMKTLRRTVLLTALSMRSKQNWKQREHQRMLLVLTCFLVRTQP